MARGALPEAQQLARNPGVLLQIAVLTWERWFHPSPRNKKYTRIRNTKRGLKTLAGRRIKEQGAVWEKQSGNTGGTALLRFERDQELPKDRVVSR